uniref:Ionotropic receptor n=2 Tax=Zeugodacus TaxID=1987911 RepID=A0A6M9TZR6_ZEUTA|nr:ionotropic receptor [Zeugodacus tau]
MWPTQTHVTTLLQLLIQRYFAQFSSVLIVHDGRVDADSALQREYLEAVQLAFRNLSQQGRVIGLQWIDVSQLDGQGSSRDGDNSGFCGSSAGKDSRNNSVDNLAYDDELELCVLRAVDIVTEGFITILSDTVRFLHARYFATRNAELRLKDKFYLFLCEHEHPEELLSTEILQFYPHHLMVTPEALGAQQGDNPQATTATRRKRNATKPTTVTTTNPLSTLTTATPSAHRDINIQLWTQKFVGARGNLEALLLDAFLPNETFARNVELYPNKVSDLRGRNIRVGSITYIPYVVANYVPAGTGDVDALNSSDYSRTLSYLGSEAELMKSFCEVRNCHLRVEPYGADNWGVIYENESATGMLGDVYTQNVEVAVGCIYNWYNNITETSNVIARSSVAILGPSPAQFPAWRAIIMPFSTELWIFLILTILLCAAVMYFIRFVASTLDKWQRSLQQDFQHTAAIGQAILDMFAVFIQQPSGPTSLHTFAARFFLAMILCATITLENTYSGQLKSILTVPLFTEAVDTMEKWSKTDWTWSAPSIVWTQTIDSSHIEKEQIMSEKFVVHDYDFLYNASFRPDYGLGIERLMSGSFTFGDFITAPALETKIISKDDLYFDWTRAVSIRGWPLMPLFDEHISACIETGLFVHWERQNVAKYLDRQTQQIMLNLASGHINKSPPQKLTIENISGATFALLFGCLIASFVFLLELSIYNFNKFQDFRNKTK